MVSHRIKEEREAYPMADQCSEEVQNTFFPAKEFNIVVVSDSIKEEREIDPMADPCSEEVNHAFCPAEEFNIVMVSDSIKEEREAYPMADPCFEEVKNASCPAALTTVVMDEEPCPPKRPKKKTYYFHQEWENDFLFTEIKDNCVCLICGAKLAVGKKSNVKRHFSTMHGHFESMFPKGSSLRSQKVNELKSALQTQKSFITTKKAAAATEASFKVTHHLIKHKATFSDGAIVKEAMLLMAESLFKDFKNSPEIMSAISDVQLGLNTMSERVSALSANMMEQLERDLKRCKYVSIQCDESVDASDIALLAMFIRMVFEDFTDKEEFLTLLPLKPTTRGADIHKEVKNYFVKTNVPLKKLVAIATDGAPAMMERHSDFIASCQADPDFPPLLNYHSIIHQQAICAKVMGFDHVMTPVVKIVNSICAKAKQHQTFKLFLEELSAEYGDLLSYAPMQWLSRGKILRRFLSLLPEVKAFMESRNEDTAQLSNTEWLLDLAFLTDVTEKLNVLNCELRGKNKTITNIISAVKTFKSKLNLFIQHVQKNKMQHFPSVLQILSENKAEAELLDTEKYSRLLVRLNQEFTDRFSDLEQLEPCVMFTSNPFMEVDVSDISDKMSVLFNLDSATMEMEILTLQNDIELKARQSDIHFWSLVDAEKYKNIHTAAMKLFTLFSSTSLCQSASSVMNFVKSTFRTCLTDEHLNDSVRVALSSYIPDYRGLVDTRQCEVSH
ncbi:general transcription factor II-I repeat domain-containing protein 2-like isoform X1 [Pleurodeles waltl]|uniref:general transcription factor II-I repeat domain-containing protein 2-like isoform X1 n=1 Tax=Pleurodeles waltl TaxID=8319 RepID=UPI003709C470